MSDDLKLDAKVLGDAELKLRFQDMGGNVRRAARTALSNIGQTLRDIMAANAPRKSGQLAGSVKASQSETGDTITETVRPTDFVARFIEYGVVNHGTRNNARSVNKADLRKTSKRLALVNRARELRAAGQYRITPRPFIGPAWDEMAAPAQAELADALAEAMKES